MFTERIFIILNTNTMKKITLILSLLISAYGFAQNVSTGVVQLASDFTVQFDVNGTTNKVTMTMIGPANVWLAVALNKSHTPGSGMGTGGEGIRNTKEEASS